MTVPQRVRALIAEVVDDASARDAADDRNLVDVGVVSSLQLMRLVTGLEQAFDIQLAIRDMSPTNFATVGSVVDLVQRRAGDTERAR
jgi:acyl carrier protein